MTCYDLVQKKSQGTPRYHTARDGFLGAAVLVQRVLVTMGSCKLLHDVGIVFFVLSVLHPACYINPGLRLQCTYHTELTMQQS